MTIRPIEDRDWEPLGPLCAGALHRVPPFSSLTDDERAAAGADCVAFVRSGGDGPLVPAASVVAADDEDGRPQGARLVVLKPAGYRDDPWGWGRRKDAAGEDAAGPRGEADASDQAHLDWIFVSPWLANRGVGSAMLARTVAVLRAAGHATLTSTFMVGNGESMAWHWRNGFELLEYPGSTRTLERRVRDRAGG